MDAGMGGDSWCCGSSGVGDADESKPVKGSSSHLHWTAQVQEEG